MTSPAGNLERLLRGRRPRGIDRPHGRNPRRMGIDGTGGRERGVNGARLACFEVEEWRPREWRIVIRVCRIKDGDPHERDNLELVNVRRRNSLRSCGCATAPALGPLAASRKREKSCVAARYGRNVTFAPSLAGS